MSTDYFAGDSRSNRERMIAGDWYIADDPISHERHRRALTLTEDYHRAVLDRSTNAAALLDDLIGGLGHEVYCSSTTAITSPSAIARSSTATSPPSTWPRS